MEYKEDKMRVSQLSFVGKVLAIFSHELKNRLAVINESAGLAMDIIEIGKSSNKKDSEQYIKPLRLIISQMEKTLVLINYFNRFSHRMDSPASAFNVNDAMEELIELINRVLNQRRISLEKNFQRDIPSIYSDPARLQFLIFCIIEDKIKRLAENSSIILKTASSNNMITVSIISKGDKAAVIEDKNMCQPDLLQEAIKKLGGELHQDENEASVKLPLKIPLGAGE